MKKAAGILFLSKKDTALFLKRTGATADYPGYWDFPGGGREDDESAEECAAREATEEIGATFPDGLRVFHTRTAGSAPKGVAGIGASSVSFPVSGDAPTADPVELEVLESPPDLPDVDFTTFIQRVEDEFVPDLNFEHDGYAWSPVESPPVPLHPGCQIAIDRLAMNELGVARAIAAGQLASPQRYENVWLFAIRITGVDLAYRPKGDEFVVRDGRHYLNPEFLARCNGLPVVWKHPKGSLLNTDEFLARIVGTVFLPYVAGAEVWAIAKIFVDSAAQMMAEGGLSTSPGVNFADWTVNRKLTIHLADGAKEKVLIEGDPSLLDHIAICELGVWDKGEEPSGIRSEAREDSAMADKDDDKAKDDAHRKDHAHRKDGEGEHKHDAHKKDESEKEEEKEKEEKEKSKDDSEEKERKDADGKETDNKLSHVMDAISKIADAVGHLGKRMDAMEESKDDSRKDAKKDESDGKAEEPVADKHKKDAHRKDADEKEKEKEKEREDHARKDAALDSKFGEIGKKIEQVRAMIPKDATDEDYNAMLDAQSRADDVFVEFGSKAPRALQGQTVMAYDRYVASKLQDHSPTWKGKDLKAINDEAFPIIRDQIFTEARQAAMNPVNLAPGELRMVERRSDGHIVRDFHGKPSAWMNQFAGQVQLKGQGRFLNENLGRQQH